MTDPLTNYLWLPPGWVDLHIAVALSGGADSMALLRGVHQLKQQQGGCGKLFALHVNHLLRGAESDEDAQWCHEQCRQMGVEFELLTCDTAQRADQQRDGIEAAARQQRYQLLTAAAERNGARYLATAHTRDDQVETILFRILRGTGLRGLSGIPRSRSLSESLTLIRPMLECTRAMVESYLAELKQEFRTDSSNKELQFARNRLRHELLPLLREHYNSAVDIALIRLGLQANEVGNFLESQAQLLLADAEMVIEGQSVALNVSGLASHDPLIVRETLRLAWRSAGFPEQAMDFAWWKALTAMVVTFGRHPTSETPKASRVLPGNVHASIDGTRLLLRRKL